MKVNKNEVSAHVLTAQEVEMIGNTITKYKGRARKIIIPSIIDRVKVTKIGDWAFSHNQLTEVTFPNSVKKIGRGAFSYNDLTEVAIPNSKTEIEDWAFNGSVKIKKG